MHHALASNHRRLPIIGAAVLLFLATIVTQSAVVAQEPASDSILTGLRQAVSKKEFVATLDLRGMPRSKLILLRNPDRVAIDLFDTVSAVEPVVVEQNAVVSEMRQGLVSSDRFRILFTLKQPALPKASFEMKDGHTILSISLTPSDAKSFAKAVATQPVGHGPDPVPLAVAQAPENDVTVVIDPGHGGIDNGAMGKSGTMEKDINLLFALALRDRLKTESHVKVIMTRDDDRFISLGERSEIARRAKANLFISMHADSIRYADIRGATVYTLSGRASDALSGEVAESENSSDRFVNPEWQKSEPEVFDILVELMRRETDSFSEHFAAGLVQELGRHKIRLIRNPKRSAGFKVLMAPDVPSVLVEIGYLSNVDDEKLLADKSWREDTAAAIATAVAGFFRPKQAEGSASPG
jgi:N-acetylmuramoyl-L-alanine amidase